jgi:hypothetical protein
MVCFMRKREFLGFRVLLGWTYCDSEWIIGIDGGFYVEKKSFCFRVACIWTDCDSEWLIGINRGFGLKMYL